MRLVCALLDYGSLLGGSRCVCVFSFFSTELLCASCWWEVLCELFCVLPVAAAVSQHLQQLQVGLTCCCRGGGLLHGSFYSDVSCRQRAALMSSKLLCWRRCNELSCLCLERRHRFPDGESCEVIIAASILQLAC